MKPFIIRPGSLRELLMRGTAAILVALEALVGWPMVIFCTVASSPAQEQARPLPDSSDESRIGTIEYPKNVTASKGKDEGLIKVKTIFKTAPTDVEIQSARIFEEPLFPIGDDSAPDENAALSRALIVFASRKNDDNVSALDEFLQAYPTSRWRVGLQTNLAILRKKAGYFTEALARLEEAWQLGKADTTPEGQALANRALGELVDLNARFGRFSRMKELFDEADNRDVAGSAAGQLSNAHEGYWRMTEKPGIGFRCGPYALNAVLCAGKKYKIDPEIAKEQSTQEGTNLLQLKNLSTRVGLNFIPARREAGAGWPAPMVVHWKVGHFAALMRQEKGRYLVKDPTFGGEIWVSTKALDTEASGYGLVAAANGKLPPGWVALSDAEAANVWGKGGSEATEPNATGNNNSKVPDCPPQGMANFNIFKMRATLQVWDAPVFYDPPFGPKMNFLVMYNHLEAGEPGSFNYTNFGPSWECNWISYAQVDGGGTVTVQLRGGGAETYDFSTFDGVSNRFQRALYSGAQLIKKSETRYEREMPDGSLEAYAQPDGTGRIFLKEIIDPQGNKMVLNYDANLRLTSIVDALGQSTSISYKSNTVGNAGFYKVYRVTDPFSRYAEFTYDAGLTRLEKIRDVIGIESVFTYGDDGFITRLTTPYGNTDFYQYIPVPIGDGIGRGLLVILPDGSREVLENYRGHTLTTYYWDRKAMALAPGDRNMAEQTYWLMSAEGHLTMDVPLWEKKALENPVYFTYPDQTAEANVGSLRQPATVTRTLDDSSVQTYQYTYNALGRVTKSIDPAGRTLEYLYAVNNLDLMEVRQTRSGNNDLLAKYTYDTRHNVLWALDASGGKTSYAYNTRGQLTDVTNAKGEVTTLIYDGSGYLRQIDGPLSGTNDRTELNYDSYGRLETATSIQGPTAAEQYTLTYNYDALNRPTLITYPDGTTDQVVYSRLDAVRKKDRLGRWTQLVYNALAQPVEERDPAGRTTLYEWCRCGALQGLTDPMGRVTKWTYDVQGRMTKKTYPDGSHQDYVYEDTISRLKNLTDPAGNVTTYAYNVDDTISGVTYDAASGFAAVADVTMLWDPNYRRLTSVGDSYTTYGYIYNPYTSDSYGTTVLGRGRVSSITNSALANATISYEYDELGRMLKRQINGSANESSRTYDAAGRMSSWSNALGSFTPTYANAGYGVSRLASVAFPNGQTVNYGWEDKTGDFRLKEIENVDTNSDLLSKFEYATDAMSRILQWKQQRGADPTERYNFGYNQVDELTGAVLKTDSTSAILKQFYYQYDAAGNRTGEQIDNTARSASYNNLNQLTSISSGGPTRFKGALNEPGTATVGGQSAWMTGGTSFQADVTLSSGTNTIAIVATDANSNTRTNTYQVVVTNSGSTTLTYDANGNLLNDGSNTYEWDALNRIVKATYAGGARSEYSYDALGRRVKIVEKDGGGSITSTKQFVYEGLEEAEQRDGGNSVKRQYFADGWRDVAGSENYFYTKDHLGSVREVTDGAGGLVSRYSYDPYGRATKLSGSVDSDMLYTGHYYDLPSGLYLTMYRAYDAELGRWISRDPIGEAGGVNLYGYVGNDPVNLTDPTGLWFGVDDAIFAGGGALVAVGGRFVVDLVSGHRSTWQDYVGSAVGGAAGGETLLYTANPFLAGAAGGLAGNLATQGLNLASGKQCTIDVGSAVFDTAFGAATGLIPGRPRIFGLNAGRGSNLQVFRQIFTKASNGTIKGISAQTAVKMGKGAFYEYAVGQGAAAGTVGSVIYGNMTQ